MRSPDFYPLLFRMQQVWQSWWRRVSAIALSLACVLAIAGCSSTGSGGGGDIVIGSKNYSEQVVLGELMAQHIEAQTDLDVERQFNLGGTFICHKAISNGNIDAYVEYTGTAFTAILERTPIADAQKTYQQVKQIYDREFDIHVFDPLGFENTYAIIIRGKDARQYNIDTISDIAPYTSDWQAGFGYEFIEREDGFTGLKQTYNLKFDEQPQVMDLGLMYRALIENKVDVVAGNSTDGLIKTFDLKVLEDNKDYFPPYQAVPVVRKAVLDEYPQLRTAIEQLSGTISEDDMRQMNYEVDGQFRKPADVAREFLKAKGLL